MEWEAPYVILRAKEGAKYTEVFQCTDFKKAKYWLTYIAEVGDVLCKTPAHPRFGSDRKVPEYFSHKTDCGIVRTNKDEWKKEIGDAPMFPTRPARELAAYD